MKNISEIESYLDGSMNAEERAAFVKKMAESPELSEEVKFHQEINDAITENDVHYFRETVKSVVRRKTPTSQKLKLSWVKYPIAAGIAVLISISVWQIVFVKSPVELYTSFYTPYETDLSMRSLGIDNSSNQSVQLSYKLYQDGDYEASYEILQNYLKRNFNDQTARFYLGMNALELGNYETAIEELSAVENDPSTPFSLHSRWYLAMLYLKTDQPEKASKYLSILTNENNLYSREASEILKKL